MKTVPSLGYQTARNMAAALEEEMRVHAKLCRTCVNLTQNANRYCDEGWKLAKAHRRAMAEAERLEPHAQGDDATLF